jgi:hypothetical protein
LSDGGQHPLPLPLDERHRTSHAGGDFYGFVIAGIWLFCENCLQWRRHSAI